MADISDVCTYLMNETAAAVYPNGTGQLSIGGMKVRVMEGWPNPDKLDKDLAGRYDDGTKRTDGPVANVSIFPMSGNNSTPFQILDETYVLFPPVFGLTITIVNGVINVSGTPTVGEYITLVTDHTFVYSRSGATLAEIISNLAADIIHDYPGVTFTGTTLTVPVQFALVVRQGAVATMGKVTHRQKQSIMVTVWAPTHASRSILASAIDNAIKAKLVVAMPDTSQVIITYNRTNVIDDRQMTTIYRRDLIYDAEYATVLQFPGYVITTVNTSIANPDGTAIAHAIT